MDIDEEMMLRRRRRKMQSAGGNAGGSSVPYVNYALAVASASNQYLTVADSAAWNWSASGGFTICGWINHATLAATQHIVGKYTSTQREWSMGTGATRFLSVRLSGDGTAQTNASTSAQVAVAGTWAFLCLRYIPANAGAEINLSVNNGTPQTAAHAAGLFNGTSRIVLGGSDVAIASSVDGKLDRFGFWSRPLSNSEVTQLYNAAAGLKYSDLDAGLKTSLVAYYDLDEATGDRVDAHAGLNMTPVNSPTRGAGV